MPTYTVRAVTESGKTVRVTEEARSEDELTHRLERAGLQVTRVLSTRDSLVHANPNWKVKRRSLIDFSDRLQIMYAAGIPMVEAMEEVMRGTRDPRMHAIIHQVKGDIEGGSTFSEAVARFPRAFPPQYLAAVRAGEESGALDVVMGRMVAQLEWEQQIRSTTVQAFIYPSILFVAVCGMLVMLFTFLLPRITAVFVSAGAELPGPTRFVMAVSAFLRENGLLLLAGLVLAVVSLIVTRRTARGKEALDGLFLRLPLIGHVQRKIASARFVAALRTLHHAGTPMLTALRLSRPASGNAAIEADVDRIIEFVEDGVTLTESVARSEQLEPLVPRMIAVGEKSGSLTEALEHVVALYDREVRASTKRLLSALEPAILVFTGVVVGFVVLATLLPMFKMLGAVKG